ncbi:ATP-dependent DNA helicase Q1-like [Sitophilus oryzae]|uniref:ATP-dependent DNA helicase n=1 Tax=Sitophilus oryzae TaxID=7048 RepID=A0A6J2XB52_SITOR|nr:ATP-dependent DNA helicase Q1-like [Sitophilus oryzae]
MLSESDFMKRQNELDQEINKLEEQKLYITNKLKSLRQEKEEQRLQYSLSCLKKKTDVSEWLQKDYPWSVKVHGLLKEIFHFETFRPNQLGAVNATLSKKHVLLVMPTGGGKSLIYQLASLVTGNLSVVISPLISLIEDQLMALKKFGISAGTVNSATPREIKKEVTERMRQNKLNIIFVTPEWIAKTMMFMKDLTKIYKQGHLARFVIDEVHCCSNWGHDFRPDYLSLSLLKNQFPGVPILGLTATATSHVLVDVQKILEIPDSVVITAPYNRPNLYYEVVPKSATKSECLEYIANLLRTKYKNQSGIIYAGTQKECEDIATDLRSYGFHIGPYHANLDSSVKSKIHRRWTENSYQAVVATIAFGMGIDKPDVRFVIHYTVPKTLEGLYQESGRAGRDGKKSDCIVMFNIADWLKIFANTQNTREERSVKDILNYCIDVSSCRRKLISKYFDDDWRSSDCDHMCDHCRNKSEDVQTYDITSYAKDISKLMNISSEKEVNWTLKKLLDSWFQSAPKSLQDSSVSKPRFSREDGQHIIGFLLCQNILKVRRGYSLVSALPYIDINRKLRSDEQVLMPYRGVLKGVTVCENTRAENGIESKKRTLTDKGSHIKMKKLKEN